MKQQLESFLYPGLIGRVEYLSTGYRYLPDKKGQCYIMVDKNEVFKMNDGNSIIKWYKTEQEIKNDLEVKVSVNQEDIEDVRKGSGGMIPEERLVVIAKNRKISICAKEIMSAQTMLGKSDFYTAASNFLSASIEDCLESRDILMNIFALVDRRVGKKRLIRMKENMKLKHPAVQYFYELRMGK